MNRRNFLAGLFAILPAATQYKRVWKAAEGCAILEPGEWMIKMPNYEGKLERFYGTSSEAWIKLFSKSPWHASNAHIFRKIVFEKKLIITEKVSAVT